MTANQKRRITLMRQQNVGYATIANELKLSLNTVKSFCRRNGLLSGSLESDTQLGNISDSSQKVDLISVGNRVNSTTAKQPGALVNTGVSGDQPACEVTVSYADEPDLGAVADVLELLTHRRYCLPPHGTSPQAPWR